MAYDIGPRIKITGEKEFNEQINKINNSLKEYGSELKAISSQHAENEKSQDALVAKNKVLQKQYDTQKQKLKLYQDQLEKQQKILSEQKKDIENLTKQYGENSKEVNKAKNAYASTENSISKLKTSINETSAFTNKLSNDINKNNQYLDEMEKGTRDAATGMSLLEDSSKKLSGTLDETNSKIDESNDKLSKIADTSKMGALLAAADELSGVGDAISNLGNKALDSFNQIENSSKKVNGYFNETGEVAKKNEELIKRIYEDGLGDSMDSVAEAVIKVKNNIKDLNDEELYDITEQALILEDTFGIDMNETLRGADALMKHFGLTSKEAMDFIVKGTQEGLNWTDELGDNISEYSGNFAQAGYSAEEYFQLLKNGADGGAYNLDKVNDSINEITNRLADGTIEKNIGLFSKGTKKLFSEWQKGGATQKEVIDSIVGDISNCTNEQEALTMAATAFGTMGEDANLNVVKSLTSLGNSFDDVTGSAQNMNNATTTESQKMEGNIRKLNDALASIGEILAGLANEILPPIIESISFLGDIFEELPEPLQMFIVILGGLVVVLTTLAPTILAVKFAINDLEISLLPMIGTIALIAAGITAIILIFQNWDAIVQWFSEQWENFTAFISENWNSFTVWIDEKIQEVSQFFADLGADISQFADDVISYFKELPGGIATWLSQTLSNIGKWGADMIDKGVTAVSNMIEDITDCFIDLPKKALKWGSDMLNGFIKGIKSKIGDLVDSVSDIADTVFGWLHFSRPDKGPLRKYETWMPDMMKGLSSGIRDNKWRIEDELSSLANSMQYVMNPQITQNSMDNYTNDISLNNTILLDGKPIYQNTERYITKGQSAKRYAMGY